MFYYNFIIIIFFGRIGVTFCCPKVKQFFFVAVSTGCIENQVVRVCHYLNNLVFLTRSSTTGFIPQLKSAMWSFHRLMVQIFCLKAVLVFSSAQGCVSIHPECLICNPFHFCVFTSMLFFRMVHALPLRPFLPTSVSLSQPCVLLLPLFFSCGHYNAAFCGKDR